MAERELVMAVEDQLPKAIAQETTIKEIEEAREDLARTIDAITDMVSPANIAQKAADKLRKRARSVDPRLAAAGAAVVVAGVAALVIWRRRR
jgi:tetrahydromethanopterin S-methyltransferase subunit G